MCSSDLIEVNDTVYDDSNGIAIYVNSVEDAPSQFNLEEPENGSSVDEFAVTLGWEESTDPEGASVSYFVFFGEQGSVAYVNTTLDEDLEVGVEDNKIYEWYVVATDGALNTTSETFVFSTLVNISALQISDVEVSVDGANFVSIDEFDTVDDIYPDSNVQVRVTVKNIHPLNDVEDVLLEIESFGFDVDIVDDEDLGTINPGANDTTVFEFDISLFEDEDTFDVVLYVEGEEGSGDEHNDTFEFEIEVEWMTHDIVIYDLDLDEDNVSSGTQDVELEVQLYNVGSNDEDNVVVTIENTALGIDITDRSEEHTSELQSHSFISYAVFCLKKKIKYECNDVLLLYKPFCI